MAVSILQTELITFGYIRKVQSLLPETGKPYDNIPVDITKLTLSYIHNYFANYGEYTWNIDNIKLIQSMSECNVGDVFESQQFQMAKLKWILQIYPKGDDMAHNGRFIVCLKPLSFDVTWDKLLFLRTAEYVEENYKHTFISKKSIDEVSRLISNETFADNIVKNGSITIKVSVKILLIMIKSSMDILDKLPVSEEDAYEKIQRFVYYINRSTLDIMKKNYGYPNYGEIFNDQWVPAIYLNGKEKTSDYVSFYLQICFWPRNTSKLVVKYSFDCNETGDSVTVSTQSFGQGFSIENQSWGKTKWFPSSNLNGIQSLTITVDVEVVEQIKIDPQQQDIQQICNEINISFLLQSLSCNSMKLL